MGADSAHQRKTVARDLTNRRYRYKGLVDEVERAANRATSSVRARVEHSIGVTEDGCEIFTLSPAGRFHPTWR